MQRIVGFGILAAVTWATQASAQTADHVIILNLPDHAKIETLTTIDASVQTRNSTITMSLDQGQMVPHTKIGPTTTVISHYLVQYDDTVTRIDGGRYHVARDISNAEVRTLGGQDYDSIVADSAVKGFKAVPHVDFTVDAKFGDIQIEDMAQVRAAIESTKIYAPPVSDAQIIEQLDLDPFQHSFRLSDVSFYGMPLAVGRTENLPPDMVHSYRVLTYARTLTLVAWDETSKTARLRYTHLRTDSEAGPPTLEGCDIDVATDTGLMTHADCHYKGGGLNIKVDRKIVP